MTRRPVRGDNPFAGLLVGFAIEGVALAVVLVLVVMFA